MKKKWKKVVSPGDVNHKKGHIPVRIAVRLSRANKRVHASCLQFMSSAVRAELISVTTAVGQIGCNAGLPRESRRCPGTHNRKR